jgi:hypothetical protein
MEPLSNQSTWPRERVDSFLESYRAPMRLAVLDEGKFPLICSLWFMYCDGRLLCATPRKSKVVRRLRNDPKCGFEIASNDPPYFGVRGRGLASISAEDGVSVLGNLVDRYLGERDTRFAQWLLERPVEEVAIAIDIEWMTSWDFTGRMSE